MKRIMSEIALPAAALFLPFLLPACAMFGDEITAEDTGQLCIAFAEGTELLSRSGLELPDTSDFQLDISGGSGNVIYSGKYGDCPETLDVSPGTYTVKVVSRKFSKPEFNAPQFGDEQCVIVKGGSRCNVSLSCTQLNAGIRLDISPDFLTVCPDAVLFLKSSEGKLMYSYSEKRAAYFLPGIISLISSRDGVDETVVSRELQAREMLDLKVEVAASASSGEISMYVDTSRIWLSDVCVVGEDKSGATVENALSVAQAIVSAGKEDVWVCGYVVGGDLTSAGASFDPPFESRTCLLLGPRSSTSDRNACVSVQLPAGDVREHLNLVDNPDVLRQKVCVKGDVVETYYGIPGVKNVSEFYVVRM